MLHVFSTIGLCACSFFFFFQAEDGIRDLTVTGVQTCALPISVNQGIDARNQVRAELLAQRIVTPDDASMPNRVVDDAASARSMAAVIDKHAMASTGGKTYSEIDRKSVV